MNLDERKLCLEERIALISEFIPLSSSNAQRALITSLKEALERERQPSTTFDMSAFDRPLHLSYDKNADEATCGIVSQHTNLFNQNKIMN